ncbi:MAG: EVE domain-containing protein [Calditrichia bacterium]
MSYWLLKTEPSVYGWKDLMNRPGRTDMWEGVRNYQARNYMRDMEIGDRAFFYHSVVKPQVITGVVEIVREAYPDPTQFDPSSGYIDPKATPENPRWFVVEVKALYEFDPPISREELKKIPELKDMVLLQKGSRLSIQPVTEEEWHIIHSLRK